MVFVNLVRILLQQKLTRLLIIGFLLHPFLQGQATKFTEKEPSKALRGSPFSGLPYEIYPFIFRKLEDKEFLLKIPTVCTQFYHSALSYYNTTSLEFPPNALHMNDHYNKTYWENKDEFPSTSLKMTPFEKFLQGSFIPESIVLINIKWVKGIFSLLNKTKKIFNSFFSCEEPPITALKQFTLKVLLRHEHLDKSRDYTPPSQILSLIGRFADLTSLNLANLPLNWTAAKVLSISLRGLTKLQSLNLSGIHHLEDKKTFLLVCPLLQLQCLDLSSTDISMMGIGNYTNLTELNLRENPQIGENFTSLSRLVNLVKLNVCGTKIRDLLFITPYSKLKVLEIGDDTLTFDETTFLKPLLSLKSLTSFSTGPPFLTDQIKKRLWENLPNLLMLYGGE